MSYWARIYIYSRPVPLVEFEKILIKGKCDPNMDESSKREFYEEGRKFFRIELNNLLESEFTIDKIKGKKINVGKTKILIKNIGPGGICFISNLKLPVKKDIALQFTMRLIEEITLYYSSANLYPTPTSVIMYLGFAGFFSNFRLILAINTLRV